MCSSCSFFITGSFSNYNYYGLAIQCIVGVLADKLLFHPLHLLWNTNLFVITPIIYIYLPFILLCYYSTSFTFNTMICYSINWKPFISFATYIEYLILIIPESLFLYSYYSYISLLILL